MSGGDGFEVPTTPLAPDRDRRPRLVVVLLVAVVAGAFGVARWTSEPDRGRVTLTPGPTMSVAEALPMATPLPILEWFTGPEAPLDDVLLEAGQVRRLRLASARLTEGGLAQPGRDLLLPGPRGGTVCLCWQGSRFESGDGRDLDLVRLDRDQREIFRTTVVSFDGIESPGSDDGPTLVTLEPSLDGRFAYLAEVVGVAMSWRVSLDMIDMVTGSIVDTVDLIAGPSVGSTRILSITAPQLRLAPDGRHLLLTAGILRDPLIGPGSTSRAWVIELDDGGLKEIIEADPIVDGRRPACHWIDFIGIDVIAQGCRVGPGDDAAGFEVRRTSLDGEDLGSIHLGAWRPAYGAPLLDSTNGIVYAWDPIARKLYAVDLVHATRRRAGAPATDEAAGPVESDGSPEPEGPPVIWSDGGAATAAGRDRTLVGSSDGRRLFVISGGPAAGDVAPGEGSEIWVFDTRSLELTGRWPALASYASLGLLEGGRWLAAIGRPGVTADGSPANWGTSLTIHGSTDGRPVVRIGDLPTNGRVTFAQTGVVAVP